MAQNRFQTFKARLQTKSDTLDIAGIPGNVAHGFMCVTTTGNIAVITDFGETITFVAVPLNTVIPVRITRIMSTNTTATGLLALENCTF